MNIFNSLVIVMGYPGSGKTTLSKLLCHNINNSFLLSNDIIRNELQFPLKGSNFTKKVYEEALLRAKKGISSGMVPIFDATFYKSEYRNIVFTYVLSNKFHGYVVNLTTSIDVCKKRIIHRAANGKSKIGGVDDLEAFNQLIKKTDQLNIFDLPCSISLVKVNCDHSRIIEYKCGCFENIVGNAILRTIND